MKIVYLRIHGSQLKKEQDYYYYGSSVFSGYAYFFAEDGVLQEIRVIERGVSKGVNKDILFPDHDLSHVDENNVSVEVGPSGSAICLYNGEVFNGIVYEFDENGILTEETQYKAQDGAYRSWYKSGLVKEYYLGPGDAEAWYENGNYRYRQFRDCRIGFDELGKVNDIKVSGDAPEGIEFLEGMQFSNSLKIHYQGIDDKVFLSILDYCQKYVEKFEFNSTNISESTILQADFSNAKEIVFKNNRFLLPGVARWLKRENPNCRIILDGKELPSIKLRINGDRLRIEGGHYYMGTMPANGIVYDFDNHGKLFGLKEVFQGKIVKTHDPKSSDELLMAGNSVLRMGARFLAVDSEHSNEKAERFLLGQQTFFGVIYLFDKDGLLVEEAYYNPEKSAYRTYYQTGWPKESSDKNGLQSWFDNGQIHEEAFGQDACIFYNEDGSVYKVRNFTEKSLDFSVQGIIPGKEMVLLGFGIDDVLLQNIFKNEHYNLLNKMTIIDANITDDSLDERKFCQLDSLDLINNDFVTKEAVEYFKKKNPACKVTLQL